MNKVKLYKKFVNLTNLLSDKVDFYKKINQNVIFKSNISKEI